MYHNTKSTFRHPTGNVPPAKKPKLDIPVSSVSSATDALWGDDIPAEELDECFLLASQMCTDTQPNTQSFQLKQPTLPPYSTDNLNPQNTTFHLKQTTPSTSLSQQQVKSHEQHNQNVMVSVNHVNNKCQNSVPQTEPVRLTDNREIHDPEKNALKYDIKKLSEENKKWKEDLFMKDGEVSNLRRQLTQSEVKLKAQLELKSHACEERVRAMKKELERVKTLAELKTLEVWKANDRLLSTTASQVVNVLEQHSDVGDDELVFKANVCESSGSILNDLLNPHLYGKSDLEVHEVKLESKYSLQVSTINRKRVSWRPSLYPYRLTVESSWSLVNQLGLQDSFMTVKSKCYTDSIFVECRAILYELLLTLHERGKEETLELLDYRDRQLIESQVEAMENPALLSNKMWYDVERGLEARRALGLLSDICTLSEHMSSLVFDVSNKGAVSQEEREVLSEVRTDNLGTAHFVFVENNHCDTEPVTSNCALDVDLRSDVATHGNNDLIHLQSNNGNVQKRSEQDISKQKRLGLQYDNKENGFLHLLSDLANMIYNQRNSFEYSGFLTGIITLLTSSLRTATLPATANCVVGDIIRVIVFSRPRIETVVALSELLFALSSNIEVMETLCHGLENKAHVDIACGLGYFKPNSCVIQILCWLLELRNTSVVSRTRLCHSVVNWVWACIKRRPYRGPTWAQCSSNETTSSCFCRARLAEVTVKLIYQTYKDFELLALTEHGEALRKALLRGIVLLHQLTETDAEFGTHMQEAEGCYQWLLIGLRNTPHDLCLDEVEGEALRELLAMEDATEPHPFTETKKTEQHFHEVCESLKSCWSLQSISHHVGTDMVEIE